MTPKPITLVLGGTKGLGYLIAQKLSKSENVITAGRSGVFRPYGYGAEEGVDLTDPESIVVMYDYFEQEDLFPVKVINCVGQNLITDTVNMTNHDLERIMAANATGIVNLIRIHHTRQAEHGVDHSVLVNVGSNAADGAGAMSLAYVAAKHALTGVTRSVARDFSPQMTTFQINLPQMTGTEMSAYIETTQAAIKGQSVVDYRAAQDAKAPGGRLMTVQQAADLVTGLVGNYNDVLAPLNGSIIRLGYPS